MKKRNPLDVLIIYYIWFIVCEKSWILQRHRETTDNFVPNTELGPSIYFIRQYALYICKAKTALT